MGFFVEILGPSAASISPLPAGSGARSMDATTLLRSALCHVVLSLACDPHAEFTEFTAPFAARDMFWYHVFALAGELWTATCVLYSSYYSYNIRGASIPDLTLNGSFELRVWAATSFFSTDTRSGGTAASDQSLASWVECEPRVLGY